MLRYRDMEKGITEIAAELGVGSGLEGSVQKRGERVRITAQLIDAGSDAHLWADSYDETLDDYFAIQTRIAALADSLVEAYPVARDAWWMGPLALRAQAGVYARVGREEEAIDILLELVPPPSWITPGSLRVDPAWEPLRYHPRFADVIEAAQ